MEVPLVAASENKYTQRQDLHVKSINPITECIKLPPQASSTKMILTSVAFHKY